MRRSEGSLLPGHHPAQWVKGRALSLKPKERIATLDCEHQPDQLPVDFALRSFPGHHAAVRWISHRLGFQPNFRSQTVPVGCQGHRSDRRACRTFGGVSA